MHFLSPVGKSLIYMYSTIVQGLLAECTTTPTSSPTRIYHFPCVANVALGILVHSNEVTLEIPWSCEHWSLVGRCFNTNTSYGIFCLRSVLRIFAKFLSFELFYLKENIITNSCAVAST